MRTRMIALALLALTLAASAHAAGSALRWGACYTDGGARARTSACGSNLGVAGPMVGSFVLDSDVAGVTGIECTLAVSGSNATLPAWWLFNAPGGIIGCRGSALSANAVISGTAVHCTDWAGGVAAGGLANYNVGFYGPNTARIRVGFAVAAPIDLAANTDYFAFNVILSNAKTTGTGSCAGCSEPICIAVNNVQVYPGVNPSLQLTTPAYGAKSEVISWQPSVPGSVCDFSGVPAFSVNTSVSGRGSVARSLPGPTYVAGTDLTLFATASPGDRFVAWAGDTTATASTLPLNVQRNLDLFATFERDPAANPALLTVTDVPNDQGSSVTVNWNRSTIDDPSFPDELCCYRIERTLNSGVNSPWVVVSNNLTANELNNYSQVVSTDADVTPNDTAVRRYRVVAVANGVAAEWVSNEVPGASVDNIAPPSPTSVSGVMSSGSATLFWPAVSVADFDHYAIYRAVDGPPAIDAAHRVATTTGTDFNDSPGYFARYAVTAVDHHGNESPATAFVTLNNTDVPGKPAPKALSFGSPYPSPMSRNMTLSVGLPHGMPVSIDVLDSQGRLVRQLASGERGAGWLTVTWDAHDARGGEAAAGVYFVRVVTPEGRNVKRVVLVP